MLQEVGDVFGLQSRSAVKTLRKYEKPAEKQNAENNDDRHLETI